jgi:hypothetical protein
METRPGVAIEPTAFGFLSSRFEEAAMRSFLMSAVLGVASLGFLGAVPSSAEARPWRYWSSSYYPTYSYYYPPAVTYYSAPADGTVTYSPTWTTSNYTPSGVTPAYYTTPVTTSYYYPTYRTYYYPRRAYWTNYSPVYYYP